MGERRSAAVLEAKHIGLLLLFCVVVGACVYLVSRVRGVTFAAVLLLVAGAGAVAGRMPTGRLRQVLGAGAGLVGLVILLVDPWVQWGRATADAVTQALVHLGAVGALCALVAMALWRSEIRSLRSRLMLLMVALSAGPALIVGQHSTAQLEQSLTKQSLDGVRSASASVAERIGSFMQMTQDVLRTASQLPTLQRYLRAHRAGRAVEPELAAQTAAVLRALHVRDPLFVQSCGLLSNEGVVLSDTASERRGRDDSSSAAFAALANGGLAGAVREGGRLVFLRRILAGDGSSLGLLRMQYHERVLQHIVGQSGDLFATAGFLALVDGEGVVIAHGDAPALSGRRLPELPDHPEFRQWEQLLGRGADTSVEPALGPARAVTAVPSTSWVVLAAASAEPLSRVISEQARQVTLLVLVVGLTALLVALLISIGVTRPLRTLTASAERFRDGDLQAPIPAVGADEVGALGRALEKMRTRLGESLEHLRERSKELEEANESLRREADARAREEAKSSNLAEELQQARKLDALGQLAGGVAHDLNNMLVPVLGEAEMLLMYGERDAEVRDGATAIIDAATHARELIGQLLAFGRKQVLQRSVVDVAEEIRGMERMITVALGGTVELEVTGLEARLHSSLDVTQLQQVLLNLSVNARDAMPSGGTLRIGLEALEDAAGEWVRLTVSDTGVGMPESVREKVFEPFFTTKAREHGTGLGLATVYGIVSQHGGRIALESALGQGCTFRIDWPRAEAPPQRPVVATGGTPSFDGTHVLVVDDEVVVRDMVHRMLEIFGATVHSVSNLAELEQALASEGPLPDVLLADVLLPGSSPGEVVERALRVHPGLPVVFMSGHADDVLDESILAQAGGRFLTKPFGMQQLVDVLGRALKERPRRAAGGA